MDSGRAAASASVSAPVSFGARRSSNTGFWWQPAWAGQAPGRASRPRGGRGERGKSGDGGEGRKGLEGQEGREGEPPSSLPCGVRAPAAVSMQPSLNQAKTLTRRRMTPDEKRTQLRYGCNKDSYKTCPYKDDLQYQLSRSYYWSGDLGRDLCFFVGNWHPFLGLLFSHPLHPWGKRERIFAFVASCCFNLLLSTLFTKVAHADDWDNIWRSMFLFISVTLPVMIFEIVFYWLSVGDVFCQGGPLHCCAQLVRCAKYVCGCCTAVFALATLLSSYILLTRNQLDAVGRPFIVSRMGRTLLSDVHTVFESQNLNWQYQLLAVVPDLVCTSLRWILPLLGL